jgi:hypothetical protein
VDGQAFREAPMPDRVAAEVTARGQHCPFLNRADDRCSTHFRLDHLDEAFDHCFDRYPECAVYQELLLERRVRRAEAAVVQRLPRGWVVMGEPRGSSRHAPSHASPAGVNVSSRHAPIVQLTIANGHSMSAAAGPVLPAAPGF